MIINQRWLNFVSREAYNTAFGNQRPVVSDQTYTPLWWTNKKLRIFCESGIFLTTTRVIKKAIDQRALEVGLKRFDIEIWGEHKSIQEQIESSLVHGQIDENKLFGLSLAEPWRGRATGGEQHGDVIITKRQFLNDAVSWGASTFSHGTMILALYNNRQVNVEFLRKVALHESGHLLGFGHHCDDFKEISGYQYDPNCNMHYSCNGDRLCSKCRDFIHQWWKTILYFI